MHTNVIEQSFPFLTRFGLMKSDKVLQTILRLFFRIWNGRHHTSGARSRRLVFKLNWICVKLIASIPTPFLPIIDRSLASFDRRGSGAIIEKLEIDAVEW